MSTIEHLNIALPAEMAAVVNGAVAGDDYASSSDVIREALKGDIDKGLADVSAGRVKDFDADRIIERGRKLLATRPPSA